MTITPLIFLLYTFVVSVFAILLFIPLSKKLKRPFNIVKGRFFLMKSYWVFVLIFSLVAIIGYWMIFSLPSTPNDLMEVKKLYLDAFNQMLTLVFAIFAGYFAFLQVIESKHDKLSEKARDRIKSKEYSSAINLLEDCIKISSMELNDWFNLMETYILDKRFNKFNDKVDLLKIDLKTPKDKLIFKFLIISNELFQQNNGKAKTHLSELVASTKETPTILSHFKWDISDAIDSDSYKSLGKEAQELYSNMGNYLLGKLTDENKSKFEAGNFGLTR